MSKDYLKEIREAIEKGIQTGGMQLSHEDCILYTMLCLHDDLRAINESLQALSSPMKEQK